jgi:hypothetical protein
MSILNRYAKRLAWALAILLLVVLAYLCFSYFEARNRITAVSAKVEQRIVTKSTEAEKHNSGRIRRDGNALKGSAIPENTKLTSIIEQLKLDADAGDAYSSCRLAMELKRCLFHNKYEVPRMERLSKLKELATNDPSPAERDWRRIQMSEDRFVTNAHVCEGFKNSEDLSADKYILQAALLGLDAAKRNVAIGTPLQLSLSRSNIDNLVARREYSKQFLNELAQKGDEAALSELARQQIDGGWWDKFTMGVSLTRNYFDATVYALAADMRVRDLKAIDPSRQNFSYIEHLALSNRISTADFEQAQAKAQQLSKTFAPIADVAESNARRAALKEKHSGAIQQVLMCRE